MNTAMGGPSQYRRVEPAAAIHIEGLACTELCVPVDRCHIGSDWGEKNQDVSKNQGEQCASQSQEACWIRHKGNAFPQ